MLSLKKSLDILKKTDALLEGHFVLSSGLHSSKYIQCAKLLSFDLIVAVALRQRGAGGQVLGD